MLNLKIKSLDNRKVEQSKVIESMDKILKENILMSMASLHGVEKTPWINTAFYAYTSKLRMFFLSPKDAIHSKNIMIDQHIAVSIFDSKQNPDDKKAGLQMTGFCQQAHSIDLVSGIKEYGTRFAGFAIKAVEDFDAISSRIYVIKPQLIKVFDEANLGDERWVTVEL